MIRNKTTVFALISGITIMSTACGLKVPGNDGYTREVKTNENQVEVYAIDLTIASENTNHVYHASYPRYKDVISAEKHGVERVFFDEKRPEIISREDFDFFYDYCKSINSNAGSGKPNLYSISLYYYDEKGNSHHDYFYEYGDTYSQEFIEVVNKFNEMCGEEVFETPTTPVELTPDFVYDNYGIGPDDFSPEELNAMFEKTNMFLSRAVESCSTTIYSDMEYYYSLLEEDKIWDLYAKRALDSREVTDEEQRAFAEKFAKELGDEWEVIDGFYDGDSIRVKKKEADEYFYITKGSYAKANGSVEDGWLEVFFDAGCEGMGYNMKVVYNKTGDYVLYGFVGCKNKAEIVNAFVEME